MFCCLLKIIIYDLWYHNYKYRSDTAGSYKKDCFISLTSRLVACQGRGGLRKQQESKNISQCKCGLAFSILDFESDTTLPQEQKIHKIQLCNYSTMQFNLFGLCQMCFRRALWYCTRYESLLKRGEDLGWQTCNPEPRQKHNKYNIIANLFAGIGHFLAPNRHLI